MLDDRRRETHPGPITRRPDRCSSHWIIRARRTTHRCTFSSRMWPSSWWGQAPGWTRNKREVSMSMSLKLGGFLPPSSSTLPPALPSRGCCPRSYRVRESMAYGQKLRRSARDEAVRPALLVCHKYGDLECPAASRQKRVEDTELRCISRIKPAHVFCIRPLGQSRR